MAHLKPGVAVWLWVAVLAASATTAMSQATLIPPIPDSQAGSPLVNLWQYALSQQKEALGDLTLRGDETTPRTYVSPEFFEVINWVPQDSPHPLYDPQFGDLLREILLDYMVEQEVRPDDPRMNRPKGLQVTNLNGKTLTFKRNDTGTFVNGKEVTESRRNGDGTATYILLQSLFNHGTTVHDIWQEYIKTVPLFDPFGRPLGGPEPPHPHLPPFGDY